MLGQNTAIPAGVIDLRKTMQLPIDILGSA